MALSLALPLRLAAFYFAYFALGAAMLAYFPLYLARRGLDAGEIALVLSLPQFARVFAPAAWGWLADRLGASRGIVAFSCAVMALAYAAMPFAGGALAIGALVALMSALSAGALPLVETIALAALAADPGRYGPIRLWGSVSFMLVVLAGGIWLDFRPVDALPWALAILAAVSLLVSLALPRAEAPARGAARAPALRARGAVPLLATGFCMAAAHGVLYAFLTLHLKSSGYSGTEIGLLWAIGVLAEIGVFLYLPAIFRRYRLASILLFSLGCAVIRFLAIAWLAQALWVLVLAQLLHAATFGSFHAAAVAAVSRVFPVSARGLGQSLFSSLSYGAGGAAGALIGGWGWQAGGPAAAFSLAAAAALAGAYFADRLRRIEL